MNNLLTAIAVFMVVVLSALFAVPMMIDWDDYRGDFEARLSEILGSRVELDGSLNVRLLPTPYLRAENLRIGESGVQGKPILDVSEMTLWVGIPPLMKGIIEASTLTLERPRLLLQFDEDGQPTFNTVKTESAAGADGEKSLVEAQISGFKLSPQLISLKNVRVSNGELVVQSVSGTETLRRVSFSGIAGVLSAVTLNGPIYFNGRYGSEEDPCFVRLAVGREVRAGQYPVRTKLTLPRNDHRFDFDGMLVEKKGRWQAKGDLKATLGRFGVHGGAAALGAEVSAMPDRVVDYDATVKEQVEAIAADELDEDGKPKKPKIRIAGLTSGEQEIILTSKVELGGTKATFSNVLLRGGSLAQPQTVRGEAVVDWDNELSLVGKADGQTIDLNMIYGLRPNGRVDNIPPSVALGNLNRLLLRQANWFETIDFKATASQIAVGQGQVRDFRLTVKSENGAINVKELGASLPGSSRVDVAGRFGSGKTEGFNGKVYLRGLQFAEFFGWAAPSVKMNLGDDEDEKKKKKQQAREQLAEDGESDGDGEKTETAKVFGKGKFIFSGRLQTDDGTVEMTDMQGTIADAALRGEFMHQRAMKKGETVTPGETRLTLRAGVVNLRQLLGKRVEVLDYEQGLTDFLKAAGLEFGGPARPGGDAGDDSVPPDAVTLNFTAQKLLFDDGAQRDVRLSWRADQQGARIVSLAGVSQNGLHVVFDKVGQESGDAATDGGEAPKLFVVEASKEAAVQDLLAWSGLFGDVDFSNDTLTRFLPLRLAVRRQGGEGVKHYRVDGVIGGNDAAFSVTVPESKDDDDPLPITLFGGLEAENGAALAARLLPIGLGKRADATAIVSAKDFGRARMTFSASGTARDGFTGQLDLNNDALSMTYHGKVRVRDEKLVSNGIVTMEGDDSRNVAQLFGLQQTGLTERQPFKGEVTIAQTAKRFEMKDLKLAVGDVQIRGTGALEEVNGQKQMRLALATEAVDIRTLLSPLQAPGFAPRGGEDGETGEVWSDVPFDTSGAIQQGDGGDQNNEESLAGYEGSEPFVSAGDGIVGEFSLSTNELLITDQLSLADARLQWRTSDKLIEIVRVEGKSLGGVFVASGDMREGEQGYSLNGVATLTGARLEEIGAAQEASLGTGEFSVNLSLSGAGRSVKGLVTNLVGEGAVQITNGELRQVSPALVGGVAASFLSASEDKSDVVDAELREAIDQAGPIRVGTLDLGLQMLDGRIRLRQPDIGVTPGNIGLEATLDLETLSWSGDWRIQPPEVNEAAPPAVYRRVEGRLTSNAGFKSALDAGEFERFINLKYKEKELRRLEQIRLEQEQRRLAEERRQAEEERRLAEERRLQAEEELRLKEEEQKRLEEQQRQLDMEIERSQLPSLFE